MTTNKGSVNKESIENNEKSTIDVDKHINAHDDDTLSHNDDMLKTEISLVLQLIEDGRNAIFNIEKFLSLLSLVFKETLKNDDLVQDFEVNILRKNSYRLTSFDNLLEIIEEYSYNENSKKKWSIIHEITETLIGFIANINDEIQSANVDNSALDKHDDINTRIAVIINDVSKILTNNNNNLQEPLQQSIENVKDVAISLSPTSGIRLLNNNPYLFFVEKILGLKPLDNWQECIDIKTYGILVHEVMRTFTFKCMKLSFNETCDDNLMHEIYKQTVDDVMKNFGIKMDKFLEEKIALISNIAISLEMSAKKRNVEVFVEKSFSSTFDGIEVRAKADRIEIDNKNKHIYIYDYKTGEPPKNAQEISGEKVQLLIIAVLILKSEQYKDFAVKKLQYIDLSGKHSIANEEIDVSKIRFTEGNLRQLINKFFTQHNNGLELSNIACLGLSEDNNGQILHFARKSVLL